MKVLLAVDGSEYSEAAVRAVLAQFAPAATEVRVFHALDWEQRLPSPYLFAQGPGAAHDVLAFRDRAVRDAEAYLSKIAERLTSAGFSVATDLRMDGDPRSAILDLAAQWPADVIVVGSHGRSGLERFFLGSVSERVVRHAPCSVQVVRRPPDAAGGR